MENGAAVPVRVACRVRPLAAEEVARDCGCAIEVVEHSEVRVDAHDTGGGAGNGENGDNVRRFTFDVAYDDDVSQDSLFNHCVADLVTGCLDGYNATVLAYGQTGSGKTHTMGMGASALRVARRDATGGRRTHPALGVLPRAFSTLFDEVGRRQLSEPYPKFCIKVSCLEVYQENVRDLLCASRDKKVLRIRDGSNGVTVEGATEVAVTSLAEAVQAVEFGAANRTTGATNMNAQSSRSHALFTLLIEELSAEERVVCSAKLHLVDLAGSERNKRSGAVGARFQESVQINQGLLCLGNVISMLGSEKGLTDNKQHVPYRSSKLTRLLRDSLGGNSRTLFLACVSPADDNAGETINTLKYANRARNIKNKPILNVQLQQSVLDEEPTKDKDNISSAAVERKKQYQQESLECDLKKLLSVKNSGNIKAGIKQVLTRLKNLVTPDRELALQQRQELEELSAKIDAQEDKHKAQVNMWANERNAAQRELLEVRADLERDEVIFANKMDELHALRDHLAMMHEDREQLRFRAIELEQENNALMSDEHEVNYAGEVISFSPQPPPPPPSSAVRTEEELENLKGQVLENLRLLEVERTKNEFTVGALRAEVKQEREQASVRESALLEQERNQAKTVLEQEREQAKVKEAALKQELEQASVRESALLEQERNQAKTVLEQEREQAKAKEAALKQELEHIKQQQQQQQRTVSSSSSGVNKLHRLDQEYITTLENDIRFHLKTINELKAKAKSSSKYFVELTLLKEEHNNLKDYLRQHARLSSLKNEPSNKHLPVPVKVSRGALQEINVPQVQQHPIRTGSNKKRRSTKENDKRASSERDMFSEAMAQALQKAQTGN